MDDKYLALQTLTRWRFQCAHELTREKNRYLQNLFQKFSSMVQQQGTSDQLFSDLFGATAMNLVDHFEDVDQIAYTPLEELSAYLVEQSKNKFVDPETLAKDIRKAAKTSYRCLLYTSHGHLRIRACPRLEETAHAGPCLSEKYVHTVE